MAANDVPSTRTSRVRLIGIGVGPGDPELITVKALNALRSCDAILVPQTEARSDTVGRAEAILLEACPDVADRIVHVPFSMKDPTGITAKRAASWAASADEAVKRFNEGARQIGFATIGDPSVYSTFSYLAASVQERVDAEIEVIPGITAMQALAAASRTPLTEGDEILALVPLKASVEPLAAVMETADTCVVYKSGRHFGELKELVHDKGREATVGINVGLDEEQLAPIDEIGEAPYFTSVLIPAVRRGKGERL